MFTDRQAGSHWISRLTHGDFPSPVGLGITDESSGVARSRPRLRRTQIGYDLTMSYSTTMPVCKPFGVAFHIHTFLGAVEAFLVSILLCS